MALDAEAALPLKWEVSFLLIQAEAALRLGLIQVLGSMMQKLAAFALLILGLIVMSGSFLYYAGNALPYPDPTPELLASQAAEANKWSLLFALGMLASTLGGAWLWRRSRSKRRANKM